MPSDISRPVRIVAAVLVALVTAFVALTFAASASAAVSQRSVYYTYDLMGRQLTAKFDSVGGSDGITNAYNGFGDLTATTSSTSGTARTVTYAYDGAGRRTQVTHPDGQAFTYGYDNLSRLSGIYQGAGTAAPLDTFTYGTNGLVSSRAEAGGSSVAYGWDDASRLTSQTDAFTGGTGNVGWTFGFNSASQIASESRTNDAYAWTGAVGVNRPYTVNGLNQYTSAGPASFTYDANGNLTGDGTWTYAYDVENRLVSAVGGGISATLRYDPLGRLSFIGGSNIGDVQFLYDGDALVLEFNSANAIINRYVHGSNAAADDPLVWYSSATVSSATRHWLHADHLGSIVARTDASGANPVINTYDEYGIPGSANTGRFGYTGQTWLYEIGLDYYKARIYSTTLGRFLQTDPVGYKDQINLYAYIGDDPANGTDPSGMYECSDKISCDAAKEGIAQIKEARDYYRSPEIGSRLPRAAGAAAALEKELGSLGTKNDGGVKISAHDTLGPAGERGNYNHGTINLYLRQIRDSGGRIGETLGHETQHYRQRNDPYGGRFAPEVRPMMMQWLIGRTPEGSIHGGHWRDYVQDRLLTQPYCPTTQQDLCAAAVNDAIQSEGGKPF